MHRGDLHPGVGDQVGELVGGEPAGHRVALAPAASRVGERLPGLGEVSGEGAGQNGSAETGGEQAERAGGAQRLDRVAYALGGLVDVLQDAVAEHRVEAVALDDVEQAEDVALDSRTRSATPASAARRSSAKSALGLGSTTVTRWPSLAAGTAKLPVPPPVSRTSRASLPVALT